MVGERCLMDRHGASCFGAGMVTGALLALSACVTQDLSPLLRGQLQATSGQEVAATVGGPVLQGALRPRPDGGSGKGEAGEDEDEGEEDIDEDGEVAEEGDPEAPPAEVEGAEAGGEAATPAATPAPTTTPPPSTSPKKAGPSAPDCKASHGDVGEEASRHMASADLSSPTGGACDNLGAWAAAAVAEQLAPWRETGITEAMFRGANDYQPRIGPWTFIRVEKGKVKGDNDWAEYMERAAKNWPFPKEELKDFSVVAEDADWPFMVKADPQAAPSRAGPVFTNANNGNFWNVLMPVQSRPQFGDSFQGNRDRSLALGAKVPWKKRKDLAVWRGNLGCSVGCGPRGPAYFPENPVKKCRDDSPHWDVNKVGVVYGCGEDLNEKRGAWMKHYRVQLVRYSVACGAECGIDARFPDIGGEHRGFVENYTGKGLFAWLGGYMDDERTAQHRYVFHVGNNGYADRSWRMFALGSTVLLVDNGWKEWYFSLLKPYVHYIPIKGDASDACEKMRWARAHPEESEAIAARGRAFVERCFTLDLVNLYCAEVMRQIGALWAKGHDR